LSPTRAAQVIRIDLTPDQAREIKTVTGHDATALEMTVQELEQRIAPDGATIGSPGGLVGLRLAGNANETLLA
jgi:hypothetical protein